MFKKFCTIGLLGLLLAIPYGCSKKTTKIDLSNQAPVVKAQPVVEKPVTKQSDTNAFVEQSMDEKARKILVPIYFEFDRSDLSSTEADKLSRIGPFLSQNPSLRILIEGNCDERGSNEYNIGLGEKRASVVKTWLTTYGIDKSRIEITSYGKERPVAPNCQDEACHAKNRRDEWKVIKN